MDDRSMGIRNVAVRRAAERGMTLIEIMIVILIMAMIATGVSLAVVSRLNAAQEKDARIGSCTIRSAVQMYIAEHPRKCPSLEDLKDGYLDAAKGAQDPWEQDYVVDCAGNAKDPDVYSLGPDGQSGEPIRCEKEKSKD
jgi:general secretion pathway protein G